MRVLRLYVRTGDLAEAAAGTEAAAGEARALVELVEEAAVRAGVEGAEGTPVGPVGEVLVLEQVAAEAAELATGGALRGMAGTAGLLRGLGRIVAAASHADVAPQVLLRLGARLRRGDDGEAEQRAVRVADLGRLYQRYRALLRGRGLDAGAVFQRGLRALSAAPPVCVREAEVIEVHGLHRALGAGAGVMEEGGPTPHGLLLAVAALGKVGRVQVVLPGGAGSAGGEEAGLSAALSSVTGALHRLHALDVEEGQAGLGPFAEGETAWARFLGRLLGGGGRAEAGAAAELAGKLVVAPLPSPRAEAVYVATAVRDLLDAGVGPGEIAVVAQTAERRGRVAEALARYGVPVYLPPRGSGRGLPPPLAVLMQIYEVLGEGDGGLPREGVIQVLTSSYLRFPGLERPWLLARALRAAGVREIAARGPEQGATGDLFAPRRGAEGELPEWQRRLTQWFRQQAAAPRSEREREAVASENRSLLGHAAAAVRELSSLPASARLSGHCAALRRLCERLGFARAGATAATGAWGGSGREAAEAAVAAERGRARDAAAVAALYQTLDELARVGRWLGLPAERGEISRGRFAAILRAALGRAVGPVASPLQVGAGGAVFVGELGALPVRARKKLFVTGMLDGELPLRPAEDGLLDEEDRRAIERVLEGAVFPLQQHDVARARLLLVEALAHSEAAQLSFAQADDEGRPLARSAWVDAAAEAAGLEVEALLRLRAPIVPWPDRARHPAELLARAALRRSLVGTEGAAARGVAALPVAERFGETGGRVRRCAGSLLPAIERRERARVEMVRAGIAIEGQRARWFAALGAAEPTSAMTPPGPAHLVGPFVGGVGDMELVDRLQPRLPGSPSHALSASALEDYAKCPFRFFVRRVLKAAPLQEGGEDLDPLASGRLHHAVLERFFRERVAAGRVPLAGDEGDRAALGRALEEELPRFAASERTGHPALFAVRVRRLEADLWRLIEREAKEPPGAKDSTGGEGVLPALFEHAFGPIAISAAGSGEEAGGDGMALHIAGIIDRVDLGPGRALVLDYKVGQLARYEEQLKPGKLLKTSFQLPLYAAALSADPVVRARSGTEGGRLRVTARYYSLRQGRVTRGVLDDPELISLTAEARQQEPERNVAEVAYRLWRRLRAGDFRVAPRTCEGCGLEAVCRVAHSPGVSGEGAGEGGAAASAATPTREWSAGDVEERR